MLRRRGLCLATPDGEIELPVPTVEHPSEVSFQDEDVVLLAVKSQDTAGAVAVLAACAPLGIRVVCAQNGPLLKALWSEGEDCLEAAGIDVVSQDEDRERRGELISVRPAAGTDRPGGSSWQSLARGAGSIESDYLNGEIVRLGRLQGMPTPANEVIRRLANEAAAAGQAPEAVPVDEVLAQTASAHEGE